MYLGICLVAAWRLNVVIARKAGVPIVSGERCHFSTEQRYTSTKDAVPPKALFRTCPHGGCYRKQCSYHPLLIGFGEAVDGWMQQVTYWKARHMLGRGSKHNRGREAGPLQTSMPWSCCS